MLNHVEWGEYKIGELFIPLKGRKKLTKEDLSPDGDVDVYSSDTTNNGIMGQTELDADYIVDHATPLYLIFGDHTRAMHIATSDFCVMDNVKVLVPKFKKVEALLFICSAWQKAIPQMGYCRHWTKAQNVKFFLPTKNGEIDFDFMERFVAELEAQRVAELEAYLTATGLKDYKLTAAEQKALDDFENNSGSNWQEFKLIDIFKVKNTQCILSRDVEANENGTPYLCASADNNAISSYISYNEKYLDKGNCIFIGGKTFVVTYQKNDFYSNDSHNLALYLKDSKNATLITQLFCISCIKCGLGYKYSWGDSISFKKIQNDIIQLPVKKGKMDFEFMAIFISAIQKLVIKDVVKYSDRKIAATKQCCKKASTSAE